MSADAQPAATRRETPWKLIGLWLGVVLAVGLQIIGPPDGVAEALQGDEGDARDAWIVLSMMALMACWWVSEAIPIPVTSLIPMVVLPITGVTTMGEATSPYMHPIVTLLMGGFIVAKTVERWNLHTRIALNIVVRAGDHPSMLVAGFMAAAALLSMWISNTATAIMMTPIALSVAAAILLDEQGLETQEASLDAPLTYALLLGVAYACSIGGLGTPVGTPTNLIVLQYLQDNAGLDISFLNWMMLGVPTVVVMLPVAWFVLTKWAFPIRAETDGAGGATVRKHLALLGPITIPEKRTLAAFGVVAALWVFRQPLQSIEVFGVAPFARLGDAMIAIFGVFLMFLIPAGAKDAKGKDGALLDWETAQTIPWGVLLLFGGGMSMAAAITATGLGDWIGGQFEGLAVLPVILLTAALATFVIFVTEITSNVATAASLMPVIGAMAASTGLDVVLLAAPLALAASCAFMLPMATGPNAVVFASGHVGIPTMIRAGVRLNVIGIFVITAVVYVFAPMAFR